jgi:hypothetical protein
MAILIGGSSSSGSSLLQTILNRHSSIYCGPETSLFAKRNLFKNWDNNKHRITLTGIKALRNPSWFLLNGLHLVDNTMLWSIKELQQIIAISPTFNSFVDKYFSKYLQHFNKNTWIEKTPTNAINFDLFLETFENAKVVHMVRNPYDTIASLVKRGYSPYFATGLYLCNTASGLSVKPNKKYFEIKYENLVNSPLEEISKLCATLGFSFEEQMMDSGVGLLDIKNEIEGWNYNANQAIGKKSVGRFEALDDSMKTEIKILSSSMILAGNHRKSENSIQDICDKLNYEYLPISKSRSFKHIKLRYLDMIERTIRTYPTHLFNYPVVFT